MRMCLIYNVEIPLVGMDAAVMRAQLLKKSTPFHMIGLNALQGIHAATPSCLLRVSHGSQ
jgi:hypothetical protein